MRKFLLLIFFSLFSIISFSQSNRLQEIVSFPENKIDYYEMAEAGSWILYLPIEFGKSSFSYSQENAINKLKNADIARIDLVYSDYPAGQDFGVLNKKRLESLQRLLPDVFNNYTIEFRKVRQTIARSKKTAEGLQHGFFIYFRPKPDRSETRKELERLKEIVSAPAPSVDDRAVADTGIKWGCTTTVVVDTTGLADTAFNYIKRMSSEGPTVVKKYSVKDYVKSGLDPKINPTDYVYWDSVYYVVIGTCFDATTDFYMYQAVDTTVATVFKRNHWKGDMIVADVTGSMYPYTGQLLKWLKLTLTDKTKRYFVFFNDGDNKEDKDKIIGKTGGIYPVLSNKYDEVEETIMKAMKNGSGGDAPENNIEALLEAGTLCSSCDSVIMIVDNWAPVKDIYLLEKSHKPVKVASAEYLIK